MWEGLTVTAQALLLAGSSLPFSTGDNSCSDEVATLPSRSSVFGDATETRKSGGQDWMNNIFFSFIPQDKQKCLFLILFFFPDVSVQRVFQTTIALKKVSYSHASRSTSALLCCQEVVISLWSFTLPLSTWIMLDVGRFEPNQNAYSMKWGSKLKKSQAHFLGESWSDWRQKALCHSSCEIFLYLINIHINYSYINTSSNHGFFPVLISRSYW